MSNDQLSPHKGANYRLEAPVVSWRGGVLRADDFDDLYFDAQDGLAESQHVFIKGTQLQDKLGTSSHLTIAETGFGTGLIFWQFWICYRHFRTIKLTTYLMSQDRYRPKLWRLHMRHFHRWHHTVWRCLTIYRHAGRGFICGILTMGRCGYIYIMVRLRHHWLRVYFRPIFGFLMGLRQLKTRKSGRHQSLTILAG